MSAAENLPEAPLILSAKTIHPPGCAAFQFGVIFLLPAARRILNGLKLAQPHEFFFRRLRQKPTATPLPDKAVNSHCQMLGNNDVRPLGIHD